MVQCRAKTQEGSGKSVEPVLQRLLSVSPIGRKALVELRHHRKSAPALHCCSSALLVSSSQFSKTHIGLVIRYTVKPTSVVVIQYVTKSTYRMAISGEAAFLTTGVLQCNPSITRMIKGEGTTGNWVNVQQNILARIQLWKLNGERTNCKGPDTWQFMTHDNESLLTKCSGNASSLFPFLKGYQGCLDQSYF